MLGLGMGFDSIFTLLMLPALLAAAAIFFMGTRYRLSAAQPASVAP